MWVYFAPVSKSTCEILLFTTAVTGPLERQSPKGDKEARKGRNTMIMSIFSLHSMHQHIPASDVCKSQWANTV